MSLTPDEIAHRAFTPSVDGYHQGEVRAFLVRVANELHHAQASLATRSSESPTTTGVGERRSPSSTNLETKLDAVLNELGTAIGLLGRPKGSTASEPSAGTSHTDASTDRGATTIANETSDEDGPDIAAEQRAVLRQLNAERTALSAQLVAIEKLAAQQTEAARYLVSVGEKTDAQLAAAQELAVRQARVAAELSTAGDKTAAQLATAEAMTEKAVSAIEALRSNPAASSARPQSELPTGPVTPTHYSAPAPSPDSTSPAAASSGTTALFGSDLDDQPLFSDSANDLLDGVLDDVMGNINDEGNPS